MAVTEKRYVSINAEGLIAGSTCHTQIDCPSFKSGSVVELADIDTRDGDMYAEYRGNARQISKCGRCQPELEWRWQDEAPCYKTYTNMVDPEDPDYLISRFCSKCEVKLECGEMGLARNMFGIWGGVFLPQKFEPRKRALTTLKQRCAILRRADDRSRVA